MRALALALVLLGGCKESAEERAKQDVEAIAAVEKIQTVEPPLQSLVPEPLGARDLKVTGLTGPGCAFRAADDAGEPIVRTNDKAAIVKLMGGIVAFASDPGGGKLPAGTWNHYVGKAHWISLEPGKPGAARFALHDAQNRVVFEAMGTLACEG
ncbi:MAG: hypothetical protein ACREBO_08995 [Novosphingobium sp.]